jgi:hypothetical protein
LTLNPKSNKPMSVKDKNKKDDTAKGGAAKGGEDNKGSASNKNAGDTSSAGKDEKEGSNINAPKQEEPKAKAPAEKQKPSIGRIVTMKTTESQRVEMNMHGIIREELPAMIVSCNEGAGTVNLKVFSDGEKDIWLRDIKEGAEEGTWNWPTKK